MKIPGSSFVPSFILPRSLRKAGPLIAHVRLQGIIATGSQFRPGLSLKTVNDTLERAFRVRKVEAVAVTVNSPGGSPVQSELIHDRIRQLADEHERKVLVFCEDVAASGGYWLATAGDEIYASESSIIGSIGVIAAGFGFVEAIKKLGIERRVHTAGEAKLTLDPFQPERKADVERLKAVQTDIHEAFKQHVRKRRGKQLKGEDKLLFSGAFWSGRRALELGLIDGLGTLHSVLKDKYGEDVEIKPVQRSTGFNLRRMLMPSSNLAEEALHAIEMRAFWQRYGL